MNTPFENFMDHALLAAEAARDRGEVPVGAILVDGKTKKIIATEGNRVLELKDPSAHAEMLVIRKGCEAMGSERLTGCDLYVTLEPCPMCAQVISYARIRRLYFGAGDEKMGGVIHGPKIFGSSSTHHCPEIFEGIGEARAKKLMQDFFRIRR